MSHENDMKIEEIKKLNLYEKISLVTQAVKNIEKNATIKQGGGTYKATNDSDVVHEINKAEAKYRLVSICNTDVDLIGSEHFTNAKGMLVYVDNVKMQVKVVNIDNPNEFEYGYAVAKGVDFGDKGTGKAMTYARKYALLNLYKIPTGEDPDAEASKKQTPVSIDELKAKVINTAIAKGDAIVLQVCEHYKVADLQDLNVNAVRQIAERWKV